MEGKTMVEVSEVTGGEVWTGYRPDKINEIAKRLEEGK